jgi:zinc/manganese transport system substrate-binding protein
MNRTIIWGVAIGIIIVAAGIFMFTSGHAPVSPTQTNTTKLHVVAAENFWGSLLAQIGGKDVSLTTIVTDPNADPHDYEATPNDARAIADADYIVVNGAG